MPTKNIEPTLKLISDYLRLEKTDNFVIPEYQRAYTWEITHCDKLWQDIESFIASETIDPYFFGTIIVDCSIPNKFNLIDGQQRTTTFLLLLKSLLIHLNNALINIPNDEESQALEAGLKAKRDKIMGILYKAEDEEIPKMLKDVAETKNILIIENKSINELYREEVKKIIEAIDFESVEKEVETFKYKKQDNKYTYFFRNFKFFYDKLSEKNPNKLNQFAKIFLEKCQVIEIRSWQIEQAITMFNSLNSTGLPLSDSDIISAQLYSKAKTPFDKSMFNEEWKRIKKLTENLNNRKIVDIDAVLQQFMYINRSINKEYVSTYVDVTVPGVRRYFTEKKRELLNEPLKLCDNLYKISKIWDTIKDYPLVKLLLKCNENIKLYLASYLYRFDPSEISPEKIKDICECLLRLFTVLELVDAGYSNTKFKTFLFGENLKLVDKSISVDTIKDDFNTHIRTSWKNEDISELVAEYEKRLLVFLNEYLYTKEKGLEFNFAENVNIEHIMPRSGGNISTIQHDAGISNIDEFNRYVNKLGNKILLEEDINKSIGNNWFRTKKQNSIRNKSGYKNSNYALAIDITKYHKDTWTKDDIDSATEKAVERIVKFIFNE